MSKQTLKIKKPKRAARKIWRDQEIVFLKTNYRKMPTDDIAKILNRTTRAVESKAKRLKMPNILIPWTDDEEMFLRTNYKKMSVENIAIAVNKTTGAIRSKAEKMDLAVPVKCELGALSVIGGYLKIKTGSGKGKANWIFANRFLWEKHHGKIPKGFVVATRKGIDKTFVIENFERLNESKEFTTENLVLLTNQENMGRFRVNYGGIITLHNIVAQIKKAINEKEELNV
ncbi:hypothetical protein [Ferrovum myxofaciens]|uniref:HNH endonuclease n=1 Tax=Ferrovum myxofaciens TaxID=416213 RepID=A0A9E6MXZ2_9PROT|nr:hypothetical protein [Ferrovum myxofaciens]QKE37425.1 MAG: hypothetical protein HO273_00660 [Ferrovum myxofaciens]QWY75073.1 MAG: hypothetical protein JVY19_01085 [Ferrovum myxofaciens]QWY77809.1 MAG: hypothetical protein JZL65_01595 [Ferrovum myxofaciens]